MVDLADEAAERVVLVCVGVGGVFVEEGGVADDGSEDGGEDGGQDDAAEGHEEDFAGLGGGGVVAVVVGCDGTPPGGGGEAD